MKLFIMAFLLPLTSFATEITEEPPTVLRTLECTANIKKYLNDKPTGRAKRIAFTIQDLKSTFSWGDGETEEGFVSVVTMRSLPKVSATTLYGEFSTNGGVEDLNKYRDGGASEDDNWAGLAWYELYTEEDRDLENPAEEVARLFLQSTVPQTQALIRKYKLVLNYWDGTEYSKIKVQYRDENAVCNLVQN